MKTAARTMIGVAAGMALAFALVIAVELFSSVVHPLPPGFTGTQQEMCDHVARYPDWVLGVVVLAWSATTYVSTRVAARLGNRWAGMAVVVLLSWAIVWNVAMLPYAPWFKVAMLACFAGACYWGLARGTRPRGPAADSQSGVRNATVPDGTE